MLKYSPISGSLPKTGFSTVNSIVLPVIPARELGALQFLALRDRRP